MAQPLPPMSALRAFEAVARRLSFTRAAEELHVTPGAVSQSVKLLEEAMGAALFHRTKRNVVLTADAYRILPDVQAAFQLLSRATGGPAPDTGGRSLAISVAPSFASKWLLPRLPKFTEAHPEIDLRITAMVSLTDFGKDGSDVAIRFGRGDYAHVQSERLFGESVAPMCSPALLRGAKRLDRPDELRQFPLLHDTSIPGETDQSAWRKWLDFAGARNVPAHRGTRFSLAEHALQAAIDGSGVVLARRCLAESDLEAGRLVQPFSLVMPLDVGYFLVMPKINQGRHEIQCFRGWLLGMLRASPITRKSRTRDSRARQRPAAARR